MIQGMQAKMLKAGVSKKIIQLLGKAIIETGQPASEIVRNVKKM